MNLLSAAAEMTAPSGSPETLSRSKHIKALSRVFQIVSKLFETDRSKFSAHSKTVLFWYISMNILIRIMRSSLRKVLTCSDSFWNLWNWHLAALDILRGRAHGRTGIRRFPGRSGKRHSELPCKVVSYMATTAAWQQQEESGQQDSCARPRNPGTGRVRK